MKKISSLVISGLFLISNTLSQNVGVGTATPAEKLDVNGNINVTGTIKVNGADGTAGQVLMKNNSGTLAWGNISEFKNMVTFTNIGTANWVVPAGVKKVWVEVWGGGGGATINGGGAGGGYVTAFFNVTQDDQMTYTIGDGGSGGATTASNGGTSSVQHNTGSVFALGGNGNTSSGTAVGGGFGGGGVGYYGIPGEAGGYNKFESYILTSTSYRESQTGGKGGDGGNSPNSGGKGGYSYRDAVTSSVIYASGGSPGKMPGGGGGGALTIGGSIFNGAQGMVIIHY